MKIKVLLLALGCSMMSFGAYAQKGGYWYSVRFW